MNKIIIVFLKKKINKDVHTKLMTKLIFPMIVGFLKKVTSCKKLLTNKLNCIIQIIFNQKNNKIKIPK